MTSARGIDVVQWRRELGRASDPAHRAAARPRDLRRRQGPKAPAAAHAVDEAMHRVRSVWPGAVDGERLTQPGSGAARPRQSVDEAVNRIGRQKLARRQSSTTSVMIARPPRDRPDARPVRCRGLEPVVSTSASTTDCAGHRLSGSPRPGGVPERLARGGCRRSSTAPGLDGKVVEGGSEPFGEGQAPDRVEVGAFVAPQQRQSISAFGKGPLRGGARRPHRPSRGTAPDAPIVCRATPVVVEGACGTGGRGLAVERERALRAPRRRGRPAASVADASTHLSRGRIKRTALWGTVALRGPPARRRRSRRTAAR